MSKLIELSVRGSRYYFFEKLSSDQIESLKNFASSFYTTSIICASDNDDDIVKEFVRQANLHLGLQLELINIDQVLVIK